MFKSLSLKTIHPLAILISLSSLILFFASSLRHLLFQSTALDLGWFDQAIYLISRGETPIVSFVDFHILGDHAAIIFYPLALFYTVYPDVHWLFAIQAIALSIGAFPLYHLSRQARLKEQQALTMAGVYLLYPLIFNVNLFDFHPEVIALPAILWGVLAARNHQLRTFCLAVIIILSCKAVLSLTVIAMGFWLLFWEKRRLYGAIALTLGMAWFIISTKLIIPHFSGKEVAAVGRYSFLGNSLGEILSNLVLKPNIVLGKIFTLPNLEYLILLLIPLIWGLSWRYLTPMIVAFPALMLNLLTDYQPQKDLIHQYSLPILPFLLLCIIAAWATEKIWLRQPKYIILWSLVCFFALAKYGYFTSRYLDSLDTWQATREAMTYINSNGSVFTAANIAPHLTHRQNIKLAIDESSDIDLSQFDYVLLNQRHPGWSSSPELVRQFTEKIKQMPEFALTYQKNDVVLFEKNR